MRRPLVTAFAELFDTRRIVSLKTILFEEYVVPEIVRSPPTLRDPPNVKLEFAGLKVIPVDPDIVLLEE